MRRMTGFGILIGLVAFLTMALGCSQEEETGVGPGVGTSGALTDPTLESMFEVLGDAQSLGRTLLNSSWFLLDSVITQQPEFDTAEGGRRYRHGGGSLAVEADSVVLVFHESSAYWWHFLRNTEIIGDDAIVLTIIDSLQFIGENGPVQWPRADHMVGLASGGDISITFPGADSMVATHDLTCEGDFMYGDDVTINGLQTFLRDSDRSGDSSFVNVDLVGVLDDMVVSSYQTYGNGCPLSGSVQYGGEISVQSYGSTGVSFSDFWGIDQTFLGDGMARYDVINTADQWTFVGACY